MFAEQLTTTTVSNDKRSRGDGSAMRSFLELCSLIEAIVLFDDIHMYLYSGMLDSDYYPLCSRLAKEGVRNRCQVAAL